MLQVFVYVLMLSIRIYSSSFVKQANTAYGALYPLDQVLSYVLIRDPVYLSNIYHRSSQMCTPIF